MCSDNSQIQLGRQLLLSVVEFAQREFVHFVIKFETGENMWFNGNKTGSETAKEIFVNL